MAAEDRDKYPNLILLCNIHHKVIDDQPLTYSVSVLHGIKRDHEEWVERRLKPSEEEEEDRKKYEILLDNWIAKFDLSGWENWTSWLLSSGQPSLDLERFNTLHGGKQWLFSRIWPNSFETLQMAFENFRWVLNDLLDIFRLHASTQQDPERLWTEKFYKLPNYEPDRYDRLLKEYEAHVDLVEDLTLELTRAANLIIIESRKYINQVFREDEGFATVTSGPNMSFKWENINPQYTEEEVELGEGIPYRGIEQFKIDVYRRDIHFAR